SGFIVLWNDERTGAGLDVYGARLSAKGIVQDPTAFPIATSATNESGPAIAEGASGTQLAAYTRFSTEAPFKGLDRSGRARSRRAERRKPRSCGRGAGRN